MTDQPLISIIVPVYKVEKYLARCVDSVLAQTYTNIEVILIDDGSPDGCPAICDEYAAKDQRIVVIHQPNAGVSAARNAGLDIAKGEYIGFVDSDDWIEPDMYEVLYGLIHKYKAEIANIDFGSFYQGENKKVLQIDESFSFTKNDAFQLLCFSRKGFNASVCSKLIKAELFSDIRFRTDITYGEDCLVSYQLAAKSERIAYTEYRCYHYFQRSTSAAHTYREDRWTAQIASRAIYDFLLDNSPENLILADYSWMNCDLSLLIILASDHVLTKEQYEKIMSHMQIHYSKAAFEKFRFGHKIGLMSAKMGRIPFIVAYKAYLAAAGKMKNH